MKTIYKMHIAGKGLELTKKQYLQVLAIMAELENSSDVIVAGEVAPISNAGFDAIGRYLVAGRDLDIDATKTIIK